MEARTMQLRILYTVNGSPQYILARSRSKATVNVLPMIHQQRQYGTTNFDVCVKTMFTSSPELTPNKDRDYSVYLLDPLESEHTPNPFSLPDSPSQSSHAAHGVAVGLGLLSLALQDDAPLSVTGTLVKTNIGEDALEVVFALRETAPPPPPPITTRTSLHRIDSVTSSASIQSSSPPCTRPSSPTVPKSKLAAAPVKSRASNASRPISSSNRMPAPAPPKPVRQSWARVYVPPPSEPSSDFMVPDTTTSICATTSTVPISQAPPSQVDAPRKLRAIDLEKDIIYTGPPPKKRGRPARKPEPARMITPPRRTTVSSRALDEDEDVKPDVSRLQYTSAPTFQAVPVASPSQDQNTLLSVLGSIDWTSVNPATLPPFVAALRDIFVPTNTGSSPGSSIPDSNRPSVPGSDATLVPSSPSHNTSERVRSSQDQDSDSDDVVVLESPRIDRSRFKHKACAVIQPPQSEPVLWGAPAGISELPPLSSVSRRLSNLSGELRTAAPRICASSPTAMLRKRTLSDARDDDSSGEDRPNKKKQLRTVQAHSVMKTPTAGSTKAARHGMSPPRARTSLGATDSSNTRRTSLTAVPASPSPRGPRQRNTTLPSSASRPSNDPSPNRLRFITAISPSRKFVVSKKSTSPLRPTSSGGLIFPTSSAPRPSIVPGKVPRTPPRTVDQSTYSLFTPTPRSANAHVLANPSPSLSIQYSRGSTKEGQGDDFEDLARSLDLEMAEEADNEESPTPSLPIASSDAETDQDNLPPWPVREHWAGLPPSSPPPPSSPQRESVVTPKRVSPFKSLSPFKLLSTPGRDQSSLDLSQDPFISPGMRALDEFLVSAGLGSPLRGDYVVHDGATLPMWDSATEASLAELLGGLTNEGGITSEELHSWFGGGEVPTSM